jgi:arsenate reductase
MAEGFARFIAPTGIRVFSAGLTPGSVDPYAIRAMKEVGVDISAYRAKGLDEVPMVEMATVVSLCDPERCPEFPRGIHHLSWPLPDPAQVVGAEDEILSAFRRVRDQIRELVSRLF